MARGESAGDRRGQPKRRKRSQSLLVSHTRSLFFSYKVEKVALLSHSSSPSRLSRLFALHQKKGEKCFFTGSRQRTMPTGVRRPSHHELALVYVLAFGGLGSNQSCQQITKILAVINMLDGRSFGHTPTTYKTKDGIY